MKRRISGAIATGPEPAGSSPRNHASQDSRTISTFSSDIAHAVSRASLLLSMQSSGLVRATAFRPKQLLRQPSGSEPFLQLHLDRLGAGVAAGRGVGDIQAELHLSSVVELRLLLPLRPD